MDREGIEEFIGKNHSMNTSIGEALDRVEPLDSVSKGRRNTDPCVTRIYAALREALLLKLLLMIP